MIKGRVKQAIESMGFRERFGQWVATKIDSRTGTVLKYIAKEESDENGLAILQIYCYDTTNVVLGCVTLDQMMNDLDDNLFDCPQPTNNAYRCVYTIEVEVPVYMDSVMPETYEMYTEQGYLTEPDIAEQVARYELNEFLNHADAPFQVLEVNPEHTTQVEEVE